jgi:spore maturation protein CgeB
VRIVMFYHSVRSDWNHGNAHFLRGVATELQRRGHDVLVYEPRDGWSAANLKAARGDAGLEGFRDIYPTLESATYEPATLDLDAALDGADLVLVHEWTDPALVGRIGEHRMVTAGYLLLFHDTHHRSLTDAAAMSAYDLRHYDGVLAFGRAIRDVYRARGWASRVWVWHEAADTHVFAPIPAGERTGDLVWIGNWGDDERTAELHEFLIDPAIDLGLDAHVHGVRYPDDARRTLASAGIAYHGWLPNYTVPQTFARFRVTVHVPRRPYARALPGIPTIRVFEALACGIPLVCAPWDDAETLFTPGADYLIAHGGAEMRRHLRDLLLDPARADEQAAHGRATILARHTCAHRVDELLDIVRQIAPSPELEAHAS